MPKRVDKLFNAAEKKELWSNQRIKKEKIITYAKVPVFFYHTKCQDVD